MAIYRLEAKRLAKHEEKVARLFDHSIFISEEERRLFQQRVNDGAISAISPELRYESSAAVLKSAPLVRGVTVEEGGAEVPFQEWVRAWEEFKAS